MNLLIKYSKNIHFWILVFFIIRLIGITNPPLEAAHSWRQTTVCMVSRNYLEVDNNILYPRIDIAGTKTGITGMEFPILNYSIYIVSEIFGYQHWYGRLINLFVSSFGILFFFKLISKYFTKELAFNSSIILLVSIWFAYSRKIMPDTFATSLSLISIFYGLAFFENNKKYLYLVFYFAFGLISILAKIPVIYLFTIFILPIFSNKYTIKTKLLFSVVSSIILIPVFLWYYVWVPHLVLEYGFWHFFMGGSFSEGFLVIANNLGPSLKHFYANSIKYIAFIFFIIGLIMSIKKKEYLMLQIFVLLFISFLIIVFISGDTFVRHSYYMIPFVPIMALFSAYGIIQIKSTKIATIILALIIIEGIWNQQQDFWLTDNQKSLSQLESQMDSLSNRNDLIAINSGENPTAMYFAHRKGWVATNKLLNTNLISLKNKGCKFVIILKTRFGTDTSIEEQIVFENKDYRIYKLSNN